MTSRVDSFQALVSVRERCQRRREVEDTFIIGHTSYRNYRCNPSAASDFTHLLESNTVLNRYCRTNTRKRNDTRKRSTFAVKFVFQHTEKNDSYAIKKQTKKANKRRTVR